MRELPHSLQSLGISLSNLLSPSYYTKIGTAAFKAKTLQRALLNQTCLQLQKECQKLAKKKNSVLRSTSIKDLKAFKRGKLIKEWKAEAPTLYKFLKSASNKKSARLKPIIGTAGALLLKGRNQRMSAVQHLVGLYLFLAAPGKRLFSLKIELYLQKDFSVYMSQF